MTKKIQIVRYSAQIVFAVLLVLELYFNLRVVIMVLFPASLIFGNFFCSWVCPYGSLQELFSSIGNKILKKRYKMPRGVQKYLQFTRYLLAPIMAFGIFSLFFELMNGYKTLLMTDLSNIVISSSLVVMGSYVIVSLFFERPFCNYLCTEAVKYGIVSIPRLFTIKREEETCINCNKCDKVCPMNITISDKKHLRNGQCINCFKCTCNCPVDNTLTYEFVKWRLPNKKNRELTLIHMETGTL